MTASLQTRVALIAGWHASAAAAHAARAMPWNPTLWTGTIEAFWTENREYTWGEIREIIQTVGVHGIARLGGGASACFSLVSAEPAPRETTREISPPGRSPWGAIEECREVYPGIHRVETASHGGYHLDPTRAAMVPAYLAKAGFVARNHGGDAAPWYEEDCDWAIVALVFPAAFPAAAQDQARRTLGALEPYASALAQWDRRFS